MQSSLSLSVSSNSSSAITRSSNAFQSIPLAHSNPVNLRFCGLRREALGFSSSSHSDSNRVRLLSTPSKKFVAASFSNNGTPKSFDYDLLIIGAGVGGHGAALHAVEKVRNLWLAV